MCIENRQTSSSISLLLKEATQVIAVEYNYE